MSKTRGEKIIERLKGFAESLENGDNITDKFTCRTIKLNLQPTAYSADLVKEVRNLLGSSQAIFAEFIGVSVKTLQDWEQGRKSPQNTACRFMDEIRGNPGYWQKRLRDSAGLADETKNGGIPC